MEPINPEGWPRPSGYSNGMATNGSTVFVAGQIGWNERHEIVSDDFLEQTKQALRNVLTVLEAADGRAADIARMTWYITDKAKYRAALREIGAAYREIFEDHYPAMTLVVVAALLEDRALVEIEATAVIP